MTDAQIEAAMARVLHRIAPEADLSQVDANANLREELDLDSMDFLHFLVGLHDELGVDIPEADYGQLTTRASIVEYLRHGAQQQTPER